MSDEVNAEIVRKVQAKNVIGNVKRFLPELGKDGDPTGAVTPLFQVYGHANGTRRGEGDNGPWVALEGRFEAVNITKDAEGNTDGRVFAGPECFLPEPMQSMIAGELEKTEPETGDDGKPVMIDGKPKMRRVVDSLEFAFEIGVKRTKTPIGYEYTTKPLIKHGGADPLADLRKKIPALAGPTTVAASAPAKGKK
jgi:hypothetical protein